jgi:endonuclease/exonuclease/phosphatase family metal-dependent hydrolase
VTLGACADSSTQPSRANGTVVKLATWNIRSGMGIRGFTTRSWSHETLNCHDHSQPLNAWGIGLPQAQLERLAADQAIVAVAIQEAWNCASPTAINAILGFKSVSRQEEGVTLLARHGLSGAFKYHRIDVPSNRWIIGGDVCLDPGCARTLTVFSTHFGGLTNDDFPGQAGRAVEFLRNERRPHVVMGDLNIYKVDAWNPSVPCTGPDHPGRVAAISLIEQAGYADAWKATQQGEGWTGMASRAGCGVPDGNLFKRIDYIFTVGARALTTAQFGRVAAASDAPSDHVGLTAEIEIPLQ